MYNKFTSLRFIIGAFFTILAVILLAGYFITSEQHRPINLYTGLAFAIFGILMMAERKGEAE